MQNEVNKFLERIFDEDVKDGDHSSLACIPSEATNSAKLLVKEAGIIAGVDMAKYIFNFVDPTLKLEIFINDGDRVQIGDIVLNVHGSSQNILKAERTVLNCMQRMSAIATKTNSMVALLNGLDTKILDTRKTTPGIRFLEKWAVRIGGGTNHRFGLYDMIMLKDNHIDYAGGITNAIEKTNQYLEKSGKQLKIEIETRNLDEVRQVLNQGNVDRIMLDNFNFNDIRTAVKLIDGKYETEASGGITMETVRKYAECGVNFISVGALTHSVHNMDLSLKAIR
ncbi:MAG: nicotinate-nucleotide pyrophosphorylase (carboxylating) [Parvicellaceae bacterium]|jgi:nicotinate-nucleotide pyrophosphorylase (carboxylating)